MVEKRKKSLFFEKNNYTHPFPRHVLQRFHVSILPRPLQWRQGLALFRNPRQEGQTLTADCLPLTQRAGHGRQTGRLPGRCLKG